MIQPVKRPRGRPRKSDVVLSGGLIKGGKFNKKIESSESESDEGTEVEVCQLETSVPLVKVRFLCAFCSDFSLLLIRNAEVVHRNCRYPYLQPSIRIIKQKKIRKKTK